MKIVIQDREGKQMMFETLFEVEELGNNCKTFICDEWLLTEVDNWSGWMGEQEPKQSATASLNLGATTGICCKCGTTNDVKFSPYDFYPYCKKHRPSVDPDKVIKTEPKTYKHI